MGMKHTMMKQLLIGVMAAGMGLAQTLAPGVFTQTKAGVTVHSFDLTKYTMMQGMAGGASSGFVLYLSTDNPKVEMYVVTVRYQVGLMRVKEQTKVVQRNWPWATTPVYLGVEEQEYSLVSITVGTLVPGPEVTIRP